MPVKSTSSNNGKQKKKVTIQSSKNSPIIPNNNLQERDPPPDDRVSHPPVLSNEDFNNEFFEPNLENFNKTDFLSYLFKLEVNPLKMDSVSPIPPSILDEYKQKYSTEADIIGNWHKDKRAKKSRTPLTDQHFKFILDYYRTLVDDNFTLLYPYLQNLINHCPLTNDSHSSDRAIGFDLRTLTRVIIHRFFPSSLLHRLSCGLIEIDDDVTHFVPEDPDQPRHCPNTISDIATNVFPAFDNNGPDHPYRQTYHLIRAVYYYYGFKFFERDLHKYYFIKYYYHNLDNDHNNPYVPLEETNPRKVHQNNQNNPNNNPHHNRKYSRSEINTLRANNYISGKFRRNRSAGQKILIKELKKLGNHDFPNVMATDSSRLKKNSDLLQLRSLLSDDRDLISDILNQIYTGSINSPQHPFYIDNHGQHVQVSQDLFDFYLPRLFNDEHKLSFSYDHTDGSFTGNLSYNKIILLLFIYYFEKKSDDIAKRKAYREFILNLAFHRAYTNNNNANNNNANNNNANNNNANNNNANNNNIVINQKASGFDSEKSLNGIRNSLPITDKIQDNRNITSHSDSGTVFQSPSAVQLLFGKGNTIDQHNANRINSDGFSILFDSEVANADEQTIEQVNFNKLYDEYYFVNKDHIPNANYTNVNFGIDDTFKAGVAQLIVRTIRSDLPKRLLTFFFIHNVLSDNNNPDQFIKIFRNKNMSTSLTDKFITALTDFIGSIFLDLHSYRPADFPVLHLTPDRITNLKTGIANKIKNAGTMDLTTSIFGLVRKFLDSAFLNNPAIRQFFKSVPLRVLRYKRVTVVDEHGHHSRVKKLVYVSLGNYRSIQRKKVRLFFHLTNRQFTEQSTYDDLEHIPNLTQTDRLAISSFRHLNESIQRSINSLLTVVGEHDTIPLPLNFMANPILMDKSTALLSPDRIQINIHGVNDNNPIESRVLNFNRYFKFFDRSSRISFLKGQYVTDPNDYPTAVKDILDFCYDALIAIPISRLGSIPRKKSLMAEFPAEIRTANSIFEISLLDKNLTDRLASIVINDSLGFSTPSFLDQLHVNIHPFGIGPDKLKFNFTISNWFNSRIKILKKQISDIDTDITVLAQGNELVDPKFVIPPFYNQISTTKLTQLQFLRSIKQRQLVFFSYCNRALAEFIVQFFIGDYIKNKQSNGSYSDQLIQYNTADYSLQSLTGGSSPIFSNATNTDVAFHTKKDLTKIGQFILKQGDFLTEHEQISTYLSNFNTTALKFKFTNLLNNLAILSDLSNIDMPTREHIAGQLNISPDSVTAIINCISDPTNTIIVQNNTWVELKRAVNTKRNFKIKYNNFEELITSVREFITRIALFQLVINCPPINPLHQQVNIAISPSDLLINIINDIPINVATVIAITNLEIDFATGILIHDQFQLFIDGQFQDVVQFDPHPIRVQRNLLFLNQYQAFIDGQYQAIVQFDSLLIIDQTHKQNSRIRLAMLRKILSNVFISAGFQIVDTFDYYSYKDSHVFRTGTAQLLPDTKLGSHRIFLKVTFPIPPVKKITASNIMGLDLGLRDLCTWAIRTKGVNTSTNVVANFFDPADIIFNHSLSPYYQISASRLNKTSKFLQRTVSKYQVYQKRFDTAHPLSQLTFASNDKRLFYLFNVRKAISSHQQKKSNVNTTTVHSVTHDLLKLALRFNVKQFNFENLSDFQSSVPAGARSFSDRYSSNLFGQVVHSMSYKAKLFGLVDDPEHNLIVVGTCNPQFTSQLCSLGTIQNNVPLPERIYRDPNHPNLPSRQGLVTALDGSCKTYSLNDNGDPRPNFMGHLFIHHAPTHFLNTIPDSQINLNRDVNAAINLTYCLNDL